jgi:hypothetical protein
MKYGKGNSACSDANSCTTLEGEHTYTDAHRYIHAHGAQTHTDTYTHRSNACITGMEPPVVNRTSPANASALLAISSRGGEGEGAELV